MPSGRHKPNNDIAMTYSVVGVCPNFWSGYITYHTWSGLHNSTYRLGKDSPAGACYYFSDSGFTPDYYTKVYLSSVDAG